MKNFIKIGAGIIVLISTTLSAAPLLFNDLSAGDNPKLLLTLSANGTNAQPYSIDDQSSGTIPWGFNAGSNWSAWNITDDAGHYYGTITLEDVSGSPAETRYVPGNDGYSVEGIHFVSIAPDQYKLTLDAVQIGSSNSNSSPNAPQPPAVLGGPFPEAPLAMPALYPNSQDPIVLSTSGNAIVNDKGAKIILKGMVRPSLEWNAQGQFLSAADIANIRSWGANVIRLDLNQSYWLNSAPISTKGSYKQIIDAIIYYATQNNMAVILDLHWLTENGGQQPMANADSISFWQQVAQQYKNFGTVIFELYNEPYGISQNEWLYGEDDCVGYQQLYDAVRGTGANNLCIVNGLDYAYDVSFINDTFRVTGSNIVYGSHPYNQKGRDGWSGPGRSFATDFAGILGKYPMIFTEFGINEESYFPTGYQSIYNTILQYVNANNISYCGFAWWADPNTSKANTFPDLISDWNGTPLNGGILVHEDFQNHPGTPIASGP